MDASRASFSTLADARRLHAQLMLPLTGALVATIASIGPLTMGTQVVILVVGVALLGMPHGAMDHRVAQRLMRDPLGAAWVPTFIAAYLGLAAAVFFVWHMAPVFALVGFLMISVMHFGLGDVESPDEVSDPLDTTTLVAAAGRGLLPIALPIIFHPGEVATLFGWLMRDEPSVSSDTMAAIAWRLAVVVAPIWAALMIASLRRRDRLVAGELLVLPLVFFALPPLLGFAIYFCLWHSARHLIDLAWWQGRSMPAQRVSAASSDFRSGSRSLMIEATPLTLVTLAAMAVASNALVPQMAPAASAVHITFVTLSALTVPHMLLTTWASHTPAADHKKKALQHAG